MLWTRIHGGWRAYVRWRSSPCAGPGGLGSRDRQFFDNVPVAEGIGAKLRRMLHSFLGAEVLPQAEQAADLGLDPTPLLAVVSDVLRICADALERPDAADS